MIMSSSVTSPDLLDSIQEGKSDEYCIIVYNNDHNSFAEVIAVLSFALNIDAMRAELHAWDIHLLGSSRVYYGSAEDCEARALIISKIGLKTEVCIA